MYTPSQSRHRRASSPPLSAAGSSQITTTQQPKLNVVTRLALEGKAKQGHDGAAIRIYLKLSIPMDMVSPGSTVPLFPEENLKLLSAVIHPIDINSVPYNFSSTAFPMLDNAVRALHLPAHSPRSYLSVFGVPTPASSPMHSSRTSSSLASSSAPSAPPLDERYTGHIIVSGYNISYILPKDFPPRFHGGDNPLRVSTFSATQLRRGSIGERNNMHFMAAIELWIPYTSRPPRAPFLVSIPVPRCLSNSIKLRIYPPNTATTSSSMASLSSADEDPGAWELASEPHVTRTTSRSGSYADMADDESSDSSAYAEGSSGGILVHGTFPSTERLRIRWAQPTKTIANNLDGRRRVGVREVKGDMTTAVLGKARDPSSGREGTHMRVEYKGTCKGVWFPGVATMLGMDIKLETGGADVVWPADSDPKWTVSGGTGYTGFDVGSPPTPVSREPSLEPVGMSTSSMLYAPSMPNRHDSSASTSSLLRAPLPSDHIPEYSFEASPTSLTPSGTLSSVSSLPLTSEGRSRASSDATSTRPPAVPITIHINMNDLVPAAKNTFTFSIAGTILVLPRPHTHLTNGHTLDGEADANTPIVLPRFSILAADSETTATIIKNESDGATVQVYNSTGDLHDAQTTKTVLQRQGMTRCGNDGGRIALRPISRSAIPSRGMAEQVADNSRLSPRPSLPSGNKVALSPLSLAPQGGLTRRRRDGPLMIPSVHVVVTPLLLKGAKYPNAHAVRVLAQAPPEADSDWLEFGLASPSSSEGEGRSHQVDLVNVNIDGVPVRFESSAFAKQVKNTMIDLGPSYDEKPRNDWITWVKIHVGDQGGMVTVDYLVNKIHDQKPIEDTKGKSAEKRDFDILIPTFALLVGRLEVTVETSSDMALSRSNFAHQQHSSDGHRLFHYSLDQFFTPTLTLAVKQSRPSIRTSFGQLGKLVLFLLWSLPAILVLMLLLNLGTEFRQMRQSLDRLEAENSLDQSKIPEPSTETVFVTTTIFASLPSSSDSGIPIMHTTTTLLIPTVSITPTPSTHLTLSSSISSSIDQSDSDTSTSTSTFTSTPTLSTSPRPSDNSLLPIPALPFEWSKLQMELSPTARLAADKVLEGLGVVWRLFKKAYHYPLDPPE